jgi:hypothetical protein
LLDVTDQRMGSARSSPRQPPGAIDFATAVLATLSSVALVVLAPLLILSFVGVAEDYGPADTGARWVAGPYAATLAVLVLSILVRRGDRRAWATLIALLLLCALIGGIQLFGSRAEAPPAADPWLQLALAALPLLFVVLLVAPRPSRAYFGPGRRSLSIS